MVEWGLIGLSTVGAYKWVKGKAPALRNTFSKAKISELFGLSRAKKAGATASTSETNASVEMLEKSNIGTIPDEFVSYGLPWTSWNQYPKVVLDGKTYAKIGNRLYTEHAVGRMLPSGLGRNASCTKGGTSMSPNFVEEVIRKGNKTVETTIKQGKQVEEWVFTLEDCKVVTQNEGNLVVTVHSRSGGAK